MFKLNQLQILSVYLSETSLIQATLALQDILYHFGIRVIRGLKICLSVLGPEA